MNFKFNPNNPKYELFFSMLSNFYILWVNLFKLITSYRLWMMFISIYSMLKDIWFLYMKAYFNYGLSMIYTIYLVSTVIVQLNANFEITIILVLLSIGLIHQIQNATHFLNQILLIMILIFNLIYSQIIHLKQLLSMRGLKPMKPYPRQWEKSFMTKHKSGTNSTLFKIFKDIFYELFLWLI